MKIGYGRVSTALQNMDLQLDALEQAGCERIFTDKISGAKSERPGLTKVKEILREGDTLVIWRLDRLGRSLKDLLEWAQYLASQGVALRSLQENIDTSTSTGKLVFHIFGAMAEFERNLIQERTQAGLAAARARGRTGGRREKLSAGKQDMAVQLYNSKQYTVKQVCEMAGISKPTLYKYLQPAVCV
jgi:DNA invertase Pin-like site-specific DNA recombinase